MSSFSIGLENGDENRSIAWVLEHPGCFAYGPDPASALAATEGAIQEYAIWVKSHGGRDDIIREEIEICPVESWEVYIIDDHYDLAREGYAVNAWFRTDWKPLSAEEIQQGLEILSWSRSDLLETLNGLDEALLTRTYPGERWSIAGVASHIATAEWWYLNRLGLSFPREEMPTDFTQQLSQVRSLLEKILPTLVGKNQVLGVHGEFWSPRKLLRRAAWHERDHTQHIRKLILR